MKTTKLANGMGTVKVSSEVAESLHKALSKKFRARVGILGSKTIRDAIKNPNGLTNAEIGLKHEKGSLSERIPRRSFLEMPLVQGIGKIATVAKIIKTEVFGKIERGSVPELAMRKAHQDLGRIGEQIVQTAFEASGPGWPPNSQMTVKLKGSDRPLIDTGQLRRSIISDVTENK